MKKLLNYKGFSKTSVFGKSTLDLTEKLAVWTVFLKPFPKLTEFWKRLYKLKVLLACLGSAVLALLLSCCRDRIACGYYLQTPQVPQSWVSLLGEPHWRLEWLNSEGKIQSKDIMQGQNMEIEIPVTWANPVTAWPYWPEHNIFPKLFKPAGALFPFDVLPQKKRSKILQLNWEAGPDTVFYWELAFANEELVSKIPANFNWPGFRELFTTDVLSEAVRKDPWLIDWRYAAEKTISSNFDRRRLVPQAVESAAIPVPPGLWYGTSPFAQPLSFKEGETPVFPVCSGVNAWISSEGILRVNSKTWVFSPVLSVPFE